MKNLGVFISESLLLGLDLLKKVRQSISRSISLSLTIIDLEVVLREFLGSAELTRAQTFYIHKLTEVIMVSKDKNFVFAFVQVVAPSLKGFNNS